MAKHIELDIKEESIHVMDAHTISGYRWKLGEIEKTEQGLKFNPERYLQFDHEHMTAIARAMKKLGKGQ